MKTALIYLAAGNSRRFGSNKLLYEIEGRPMYRHLLDRLVRIAGTFPDCEVLVVTRYEEIRESVEALRTNGEPVRCVWSPESAKGASYSIRAGLLEAIRLGAQEAAFFVADQPWLTEASVQGFLQLMQSAGETQEPGQEDAATERLGCVRYRDREGNPVWFGKAYFPELLELKEEEGGKKVFRRHRDKARYYEIQDRKELEDMDYLQGGSRMKEYLTGIQHIGIPTKDMDATVAFYQKLGFEIAFETINEANGARVVFLKLNNLVIETYEEKEIKMEYGSIDHLAIDVTDIEKTYEEVCALGLNNQPDEIHFLPFWENGVRYFKIDGPNRECIEFSQML